MSQLTNNDYKQILEYYKKNIPQSSRLLKKKAEEIIAKKLCRCIKKIEPENEARSIGICSKTIFNRKGYTRGKFKCKGKRIVTVKKTIKNRN
jgi:hypothetical protein